MDRLKSPSDHDQIFQKQSIKKLTLLYNNVITLGEESYKPQDVLQSVYNQVKAIQKADCLQTERKSSKYLRNASKSQFLPVNKLPVYATNSDMQEIPVAKVAKLDTQCYLDTQLINIIDGVDTISPNIGMTQEFDTTFAHIEDTNEIDDISLSTNNACNVVSENNTLDLVQKSTTLKNKIKEYDIFMSDNSSENEEQENDDNIKSNHNISSSEEIAKVIISNKKYLNISSKTATDDTVTFIEENISKHQEEIEELDEIFQNENETTDMINKGSNDCDEIDIDTGQYSQAPPSPVLNMKSLNKKIRAPSPLVVSLETFENFESLAMSLIEETDFKTAKHLINSQILGRELCLNEDNLVLQRDSPVLDYKSDELQIKAKDIIWSPVKNTIMQNIDDIVEKSSDVLQDEILFSSDEEDSNIIVKKISCENLIDINALAHQENEIDEDNQELPLTCAIEISDDETSVLDNSLFVGFQTASNKSIQISKDSYEKAHSILSGDKNAEEISLTELVTKCDTSNTQIVQKIIRQCPKDKDDILLKSNSLPSSVEGTKVRTENKISQKRISIQTSFQTASFKKIHISDKALEKVRAVFHDIDLSENLAMNTKLIQSENSIYNIANVNKIEDDTINDDLLLKELENIEMSLEKEEDTECVKSSPCQNESNNNKNINMPHEINTENIFITENYQTLKTTHDINEPSTSSVKFVGLKTASSKEIKISEEAFAKTKDVFKDLGKNKKIIKTTEDIMSPPSTSKSFVGFKTASNKNIYVSDVAHAKTKHIFKEIDKEETQISSPKSLLNSLSKSEFGELKTDFDTNVQVCESSLCKNNRIFNAKVLLTELKDTSSHKAFEGFKTASNNDIFISKVALLKSMKIFEGIDTENTKMDTIPITKSEDKDTPSNTACHQNDKVSVDIIPKCSKLLLKPEEDIMFVQCDFDELEPIFRGFESQNPKTDESAKQIIETRSKILEGNFDKTKEIVDTENKINIQSPTKAFVQFSTGDNKKEDALEQNKMRMDTDCDGEPKAKLNSSEHVIFKGFQTASNKPVSITADAIAKSKRIFDDIDKIDDYKTKKTTKAIEKNKDIQMARNIPVNVNNNALIASKKIFDDIDLIEKDQSKSYFVGFKTANNKNVDISTEAIAKCKKLFDDIEDLPLITNTSKETKGQIFTGLDNNKSETLKKEMKTGFIGFQTASNNKVTVSKEALAKSKQIFQDINNKTDISNSDTCLEMEDSKKDLLKEKFGFQTGRNKEIKVSEAALKESKKVFADDLQLKGGIFTDVGKTSPKLPDKIKKYSEAKSDVLDIEGMIDTQISNNFDENLCTEDFRETLKPNKRSGSPVLSCPKAKRRKKFETPYKTHTKTKAKPLDQKEKGTKLENTLSFRGDYKNNKTYTLVDISKMESGNIKNIDPYLLNFNVENLLNFEFDEHRNDLKEGILTIEELKQLFLDATDEKLIPDGWLDIQLKLILWKLISYEIRFPISLGKVCTVRNVIDQLKYRYDKELYNAERPILRKILEKDDVPIRTMVLCVAGIYVDGVNVASATSSNNIELLLTDGWYFIKATIDNMLSKLVYDGKISVGCKIVTCGADLVNCEQGIAPWEDTSAVRLSLSGNSTRPAPWHAKLGLRSATLLSRLKSVQVGGGKAARLRVRVTRVYPSLYVEKFQDGSTVTRSERLELQYQTKYEAENEAMIEKIYEEVEKEMSDQDSQDSEPSSKRQCFETGSQIAKMMKACKDPMEFRGQLTSSQVDLLQDHMSKQRDRYLHVIQSRVAERVRSRNVVTLARGRVVGVERDGDTVNVTKGMLSIWKPNDEVLDIFKEGAWIEVTNIVPTAFKNSEIQLSAGRQSVFRPIKRKEHIFEHRLTTLSRTCHLIKDLSENPGMVTEYNEIDTTGIIFSIDPPTQEFDAKTQFQNVYLADLDKNMIVVNFWGGIKKFGYENILDTGQAVFCSNLQKRAGNTRKNIPQYRATEFSLFTKTPKNEKAREIIDEMHKKLYALDRRKFCEDCIAIKQYYSILKYNQNVTPCRFNRSDYNLTKNKMFIETPAGGTVKSKVEDFNLTGLDFESTFRQTDSQELSPKTLLRKKKVNERIAKLKMYGEPPPLSPINIINKSKNAVNSYKSPLVRNDSTALSDCAGAASKINNERRVTTPTKMGKYIADDNNEDTGSPVIPLNRTYVKRSGVNPVKLNFSVNSNLDKSVDHFAEEFDESPPLSLE